MQETEIEKDLVRWRRGKWIAVIAVVFFIQLGFFIAASQRVSPVRNVYPAEPQLALASPEQDFNREWLQLENPFLFAAASSNGFSGEAWLRQPAWQIPEPRKRTGPDYLQLAEAKKIETRRDGPPEFSFTEKPPVAVQLAAPSLQPSQPFQSSILLLEGFSTRRLINPLPIPSQYHSDVLSSTVVETLVGRDGLVISARIIDGSGSARADADALSLARRARFTPAKAAQNLPEVGKLIFQWFTLNLNDTNNVKR